MPKQPSSKRPFGAAALILAIATGLYYAPNNPAATFRSALQDALRPGQQMLRSGAAEGLARFRQFQDAGALERRIAELETENQSLRLAQRQTELQAALLQKKSANADQHGGGPYSASEGERLFVSELLEAAVLGEGTRALWRTGKLLDKGRTDGVVEESLVLDDSRPLIDQGRTSGIEPEQNVYAGRCVVGRVASVSRWTSTVERVTDQNYRGLAQLARQTSRGLIFLSEGIILGNGSATMRLNDIPATDAVEIGDEVYTGGRDGRLRYPMYYGKVVAARLNAGGATWEIHVEPAVTDFNLETVQILRSRLNPHRVAAQ